MRLSSGLGTALLAGGMLATVSAVELPRMFSDHGVFQRGEVVPVWGWGDPGSVRRDGLGNAQCAASPFFTLAHQAAEQSTHIQAQ